ncbi:hypothetical protein, partial [Sansalvadorimonas verongulae]|uniref:hypothetical protein n=1 Tax=Sansalvadorimonas verongulae TaxID=2172824 RepID=UPI001E2BD10B
MSGITWGVNGRGERHFLCAHCEIVFGPVDPETINHKCDTTKPKYRNRDKLATCHSDAGKIYTNSTG